MAIATTDLDKRIEPLLQRATDVGECIIELGRLWEEVDRRLPAKATGSARFIYEFAEMVLERSGQPSSVSEDPEALRRTYEALENRWLNESSGSGRHGLVSAIRHRVLHGDGAGSPDASPVPLARTVPFKADGLCCNKIELQVVFPPLAHDAHRGIATILRKGSSAPIAELPVAEITGYKLAAHSIEALGRLHRFSERGRGQVTYGDWFTVDGFGRELAAAMVSGLVVRTGEQTPNGMGGVSPVYALTSAGKAWVIRQPRLPELFDHFNQIERHTAFLTGSHGTVPFDSQTGAVLGLYGDVEAAPLYVDIPKCAVLIVAGDTYDVLSLAYHAVGDRYELPCEDDMQESQHEANAPGM